MKFKYTKEFLENKIQSSNSFNELMIQCGLKPYSSQHSIRKYIDLYNLDISNFIRIHNTYTNNELFIYNSKASRATVRKRIIDYNLIEYKCQICGNNGEWLDKEIPLILDHIDGIGNNNELKNLRWLCSNCDSMQDTYKSKNRNSSKNKNRIIKSDIKISNIYKEKLKKEQIKIQNLEDLKLKILNSNIDFSKMGWGVKVGKLLNLTSSYALIWVKNNLPEFYEKNCWNSENESYIKKEQTIKKENKELKHLKLKNLIEQINNSNIDFKKRGCFVEANKILKFSQTCDAIKWLKRNIPELL